MLTLTNIRPKRDPVSNAVYDPVLDQLRHTNGSLPVRAGHMPNWFRWAAVRAFRDSSIPRGYDQSRSAASQYIQRGDVSWLDHWGSTTTPDGRSAFVSEPYGRASTPDGPVSDSLSIHIAAMAEMLDCDYEISLNSWWYPGHTVQILLIDRGGDPDNYFFRRLMEVWPAEPVHPRRAYWSGNHEALMELVDREFPRGGDQIPALIRKFTGRESNGRRLTRVGNKWAAVPVA